MQRNVKHLHMPGANLLAKSRVPEECHLSKELYQLSQEHQDRSAGVNDQSTRRCRQTDEYVIVEALVSDART